MFSFQRALGSVSSTTPCLPTLYWPTVGQHRSPELFLTSVYDGLVNFLTSVALRGKPREETTCIMPSIIGMMQVPEATRVKSTKWAMVGYSAALVALSVVSVVLQGDPFSQHIGSLSPSGKGGGNILLSTGPQQQLAAVASEGSSASRKLLQCGECGCGVACPGGGGGATQVNMVRPFLPTLLFL